MKPSIQYLYWIEFKYTGPFEGEPNFKHGFYSTSPNPKYVTRTANNYMKKHHIPAEIVTIAEPQMYFRF